MVTQKCVLGDSRLKSPLSFLKSVIFGQKKEFQSQRAGRNNPIFGELSEAQMAVWCRLSPGIDPDQWAFICRCLGRLTPQEFSLASRRIKMPHNGVKNHFSTSKSPFKMEGMSFKSTNDPGVENALKQHMPGRLERDVSTISSNIPIVSTGPSGIGGEFQREIRKY
ncbi:MAG: hypothetical protein K9M57_03915 [Phycisphaerae bacterium]|nr:hypothetical protein [Phycisphaerae bacterium]